MRGHWTWDRKTRKFVEYVEEVKVVDAPTIITDEMPALKHMANSKYYTSKRKFRDVTRAMGFEEVGDQVDWRASKPVDPKEDEQRRADIERSYYEVRDGQAPLSEFDKERCKIINKHVKESRDNRELAPDGSERK